MLAKAIADGVVPPTCLLGGEILAGWRLRGQKPCDGCLGPRKKCKGSRRVDDDTRPGERHAMELIDDALRDPDVIAFYKVLAGEVPDEDIDEEDDEPKDLQLPYL